MTLPPEVVLEDRRLEQATTSASEALMRHRWHWTLDESNPKRVSLREYAREVGKSRTLIAKDANGYVLFMSDPDIGVTNARERASMGAETWAATEAVAKARGLQPTTVRQDRPVEVRRVREIARERAEQRGTNVEDETRKAADWIVRSEKTNERVATDRRQRLGLRFIELEERLQRTKRELVQIVNLAAAVQWGDEERELLTTTLANVKALIELANLALVGAADIDWDAELATLEGGH